MFRAWHIAAVLIFSSAVLCAADYSSEQEAPLRGSTSRLTAAAEAFEVLGIDKTSIREDAAAMGTLLPSLILEHLSREMKRDVGIDERKEDALWPIRQERLSLFEKLDNAIAERDSVVLLPLGNSARKRRLKAAEKTIRTAKDELDSNIKKAAKAEEEVLKRAAKAKAGGEKDAPIPIGIYKDDSTALWDAGLEKAYDTDDKHTSVRYASAAKASGIDALITGEITMRGGYVLCEAAVYVYPLGKEAGRTRDVGSASDLPSLAARLSEAITPFLTNTMPSKAVITIEPADAAAKASLSIDDNVYHGEDKSLKDGVTLSAGLHTLSFSAEGYRPVSATYSFAGGKEYSVDAVMQTAQDEELYVRFEGLQGQVPISVLSNGSVLPFSNGAHTESCIKIDGSAILGVVLTEEGSPVQFYVPPSLVLAGETLLVKTETLDRAAYIDKRRRWFYASYSVLITSLIGAFYTAGRYNSFGGYESQETLDRWKTANNICIGVSCACGAWAIYELVRYLRSASKTLPDEAKKADYERDGLALPSESESKSSEEAIHSPQREDTSEDNLSAPYERDDR